ncbi:hypothetical protein COCCU_08405 [Corynebacterium occultum]|uniref:Uncharacterized protein n=1 Tax=Corynebacterium occultum TaxID=2675219 RepID=A0A6B8W8I9_9CORY|nr:hypothetical protein COCCU_08405 [Corynebacterium occultum]
MHCSVRPARNRAATASSWRMWPNVNDRRNEPSVEGAHIRVKSLLMPPESELIHVIDRVSTGDHARDKGGDLGTSIRAFVAGHTQQVLKQRAQARIIG